MNKYLLPPRTPAKRQHLFLCLAVLISLLLGMAAKASAEEKSPLLLPPTSGRTIYMIYYKLARLDPKFSKVVSMTPLYKATPPSLQEDFLKRETKKLEYDFAEIDPKQEPIVIRSAVKVKVDTMRYPGMDVSLPGSSAPPASLYFPYSWGGQYLALIPDKMQTLMNIPMKPEEARGAAARAVDGTATMVLEMIPLYADARGPMYLDNVNQNLLMTKVISAGYYNQNLQPIWSWHDPSYRRAAASPLQDLKK